MRDGEGNITAFAEAAIGIVSTLGGTVDVVDDAGRARDQPRTVGELTLEVAPMVTAVDEVAGLWVSERSPVLLYKIYEVIRDQLGSEPFAITDLVSRRELTRLTRSANHPGALGADTRHARSSEEPPSDPILIGEMIGFISGMIERWIRRLAIERQIPTTTQP